jgi:hypothetical protein
MEGLFGGFFDTLGRRSESLNLFVATAYPPRRIKHGQDALERMVREGLNPQSSQESLRFSLDATRMGWRIMLLCSGLFMVGAAYLGYRTAGNTGTYIGLGIGLFPATASFLGEADMLWRLVVLAAARTRIRQNDGVPDRRAERLINVARVNDGLILVQCTVGLVVALTVSFAR